MTRKETVTPGDLRPGALEVIPRARRRARIEVVSGADQTERPCDRALVSTDLSGFTLRLGTLPYQSDVDANGQPVRNSDWQPDLVEIEYGLSPALGKDAVRMVLPSEDRICLYAKSPRGIPFLAVAPAKFEPEQGGPENPDGILWGVQEFPSEFRKRWMVSPSCPEDERDAVTAWLNGPCAPVWTEPYNPSPRWTRFRATEEDASSHSGIRIGFCEVPWVFLDAKPVLFASRATAPTQDPSGNPQTPLPDHKSALRVRRLSRELLAGLSGTNGDKLLGAGFAPAPILLNARSGSVVVAAARLVHLVCGAETE